MSRQCDQERLQHERQHVNGAVLVTSSRLSCRENQDTKGNRGVLTELDEVIPCTHIQIALIISKPPLIFGPFSLEPS